VSKSKMDSPSIRKKVIQRLAMAESQESIARDVGLNQSQVSRFANREEIKEFIEREQMKLMEVIPDAVENVKGLVREMPTIPKKATKRRELSYKASLDTLKAGGIMPSPVQSLVITNIYEQRNLNIHPIVEDVVSKYADSLMEEPVEDNDQDGDPTDVKKIE
jgi:hypothetical protein